MRRVCRATPYTRSNMRNRNANCGEHNPSPHLKWRLLYLAMECLAILGVNFRIIARPGARHADIAPQAGVLGCQISAS
jgi:hypothetical protein